MFIASPEQADIFHFIENEKGNLQIDAGPGSGKTSVLVEAVGRLPASLQARLLVCAFNRDIKLAIEAKLKPVAPRATVSTLHAAGLRAVGLFHQRQHGSRFAGDVDARKYRAIIEAYALNNEWRKNPIVADDKEDELYQLVNMVRVTLTEPEDKEALEALVMQKDIDLSAPDVQFEALPRILRAGIHGIPNREADGRPSLKWQECIDYTDMVWLPEVLQIPMPQFSMVMVDEAQDLNRAQLALVLNSLASDGRLIAVGDPRQCQPAGTMVELTGGHRKPIEELRVGDELVSYDRRASAFVGRASQGRRVLDISHRPYTGKLLTIRVAGRETRCTPEHRWITRWNTRSTQLNAVYIMRKGSRYRIGWCQLFSKGDYQGKAVGTLHLGQRTRIERADAAWILSIHNTKTAASVQESILSIRYGIPTIPFQPVYGAQHITREAIDAIFEGLGPDVQQHAEKCLRDFGRDPRFPFYTTALQKRQGRTTIFETQACNLIPDLMKAPVYDGERDVRWEPLTVSEEEFSGDVYSMEVETHETYVADGIATHNSIYAFAGANARSWQEIAERTGATSLPLTICWRCPELVVEECRKIYPNIQARPGAPKGVVERIKERSFDEMVTPADMVVCRTNAPIITKAFQLLAQGKPAKVRGRDIGAQLKKLLDTVSKYPGFSWNRFSDCVESWAETQYYNLAGKKNSEAKIIALKERVESLHAIQEGAVARGATSFGDLRTWIEEMFADEDDRRYVLLSSIHKCVSLDTLVETPAGLMPIRDIEPMGCIATPIGLQGYHEKSHLPEGAALKITTRSGYSLTVTPEHGLTTWNKSDSRIEAQSLQPGDWLRLKLGTTIEPLEAPLTPVPDVPTGREKRCFLPATVTEELAEFLGLMVADGTLFLRGVRLCKRYSSVVQRFAALAQTLFHLQAHVFDHGSANCLCAEVDSTYLANWLRKFSGVQPNVKGIPQEILRSPLNVQAAFLRGLFEDGSVNLRGNLVDHIHWETKFPEMAMTVQVMLLRFGIVASRTKRPSQKEISSLYLFGQQANKFRHKIGFVAPEKQGALDKGTFGKEIMHSVPLTHDELTALRPGLDRSGWNNGRTRGSLSRHKVEQALACINVPAIRERMEWHYERIRSIEPVTCETMCISVPNGHRFLQNGFDGWNSKGLESRRVFWLRPELSPHPMSKTAESQEQEKNLMWVATSRALGELYYIETAQPGQDEKKEEEKKDEPANP